MQDIKRLTHKKVGSERTKHLNNSIMGFVVI